MTEVGGFPRGDKEPMEAKVADFSIQIAIRNFSGYDLTRQGLSVDPGQWSELGAKIPAESIGSLGTSSFSCEATFPETSLAGWVEYLCVAGLWRITWSMPFIGSNTVSIVPPGAYEGDLIGDLSQRHVFVKMVLLPPI